MAKITVLFILVLFSGCVVVPVGTTTTTTTTVEKKEDGGETKTTTTVVEKQSSVPTTTYVPAPVVQLCNGPWGPAPCTYPMYLYPYFGPSFYFRWGGGGGNRGHWRGR